MCGPVRYKYVAEVLTVTSFLFHFTLLAKFHYAILLPNQLASEPARELVRELVCNLLVSWSQTC